MRIEDLEDERGVEHSVLQTVAAKEFYAALDPIVVKQPAVLPRPGFAQAGSDFGQGETRHRGLV